jgi:hypothetical protein
MKMEMSIPNIKIEEPKPQETQHVYMNKQIGIVKFVAKLGVSGKYEKDSRIL